MILDFHLKSCQTSITAICCLRKAYEVKATIDSFQFALTFLLFFIHKPQV